MEKRNEIYRLESETDLTISVQKTKPYSGKNPLPEEITFLIENVKKEDLIERNAIVSISKAEAKELIKILLDMI